MPTPEQREMLATIDALTADLANATENAAKWFALCQDQARTAADNFLKIAELESELSLLRRCVASEDVMAEYCCDDSEECHADWCVAWREWRRRYGNREDRP